VAIVIHPPPPSPPTKPWSAAVASLLPWVAFEVTLAVSAHWTDDSISALALIVVSPGYLVFVALPALLPLVAAPPGRVRMTVLAVMTAVAVVAASLVTTSDDAQAGLAVSYVPYVGVPLGALIWITRTTVNARQHASRQSWSLARPSDRVAALAIDVVVVVSVLGLPMSAISRSDLTVIATFLTVGAIYLGAPLAIGGASLGQSILRVRVVDAESGNRIGPVRALLRSSVVAMEVAAALTIVLALVGIVDLAAATSNGRSLTDRLFRTAVVTRRSEHVEVAT
jgi:uncharacterized RDD family membrane protein YckC